MSNFRHTQNHDLDLSQTPNHNWHNPNSVHPLPTMLDQRQFELCAKEPCNTDQHRRAIRRQCDRMKKRGDCRFRPYFRAEGNALEVRITGTMPNPAGLSRQQHNRIVFHQRQFLDAIGKNHIKKCKGIWQLRQG